MTIPSYEAFMLPMLKRVSDGVLALKELVQLLSDDLGLSLEEKEMLLSSGKATIAYSRVAWAGTYLVQAGLLSRPRRGHFSITQRGAEVVKNQGAALSKEFLMQFDEFRAFLDRSKVNLEESKLESLELKLHDESLVETARSPIEMIDSAVVEINAALKSEVLTRVRASEPKVFEKLIIELLLAMGYGASGGGTHVGKPNDEGIDGIISEDALGLDQVYLQAKRFQEANNVGIKDVQAFIGALVGRGAQKGVLITTSKFSKQALEFSAKGVQHRLILVDGERLSELMLRYNVGIRVERSIEIKRIDDDFFFELESL